MTPVILIIDDDIISHRFVTKALGHCFELKSSDNGPEGLALARSIKPDAILLDVEMQDMDGYEVCSQIKQDEEIGDIPVIFLTSLSSMPDRMRGYDVGATDYIVKPFDPHTLRAKLNVLVEHHTLEAKLRQTAVDAQNIADMALSSTSEFGQVIQFIDSVATIDSIDALAMKVTKACTNLGLNSVLFVETSEGEQWFSPWNSVSPLEKQVIKLLRLEQQVNDFGPRTVINCPMISIMIKNMPIEDPERYDRIKDIVPALATTANNKIEAMLGTSRTDQQSASIKKTFEKAHGIVTELFKERDQYQLEVDQTLRSMFEELQTRLPHMGLDEQQEIYIVDRIDRGVLRVRELEDQGMQACVRIQAVMRDLESLVIRIN